MEVDLPETENVWKPARLRGSLVDRDETADLCKKVRNILNKLTLHKFHTLVQQLESLPINNSERLHGVVDLVFEKAISEPMYSEVYAQVCKVLSNVQVRNGSENGQPENFRKLLLSRCQHEFEKNTQADPKRDERLGETEQCTDSERKEELLLEFEEMERQLQMKSMGNIKFVGELFKLGMLTSNVMHRCIRHLLKQRDEVSLECLCALLTRIGKDVESKKHDLSKYFEEMKVLSKQSGQLSSRVRFMIQNVIELRENKWVPRWDDSTQKTIEQIQREAERESMMEMQMPYGGGGRSRCGGRDNRGGDSRKRGGPIKYGWQSAQRKNLDTSKLRIKASDLFSVSPGGSNQFAAWTQGAGGNSDSDCSPAFPQTSKPFAALRDVEDKKRGVGMLSRAYGKQPPSSSADREKAVNTLRNFVCEGSSARQTPAPSSSQSCDDLAAATQPVASSSSAISDQDARKNLPHLSPNQVAKKTQFVLEEFVNNNNYEVSALSVLETFPPSNMGSFVTETMNILLERSAPIRSNVGKLMGHLMKEGILTTEQFVQGFKEIAEVADDLTIDVPKVWVYLAEVLVPMLSTEVLSFSDLKTATTGLHQLVVEILRLLVKEKGSGWIKQRWDATGMSWKGFASAHCMDRIVKENSDLMNVLLSGSHQFDSQRRGAGGGSDSELPLTVTSDASSGLQEVDAEESGVIVSSWPDGKQHPSSDTGCEELGHTGHNILSAKNDEPQVQSVSNTTPSVSSAGECSLVAQTPALSPSQSHDDVAAVDSVILDGDTCRNLSQLCPDQVSKKIKLIFKEFLSNNNIQESMLSVSEAFPPSDTGTFIVGAVTLLLERPASVRSNVGNLMAHLLEEGVLTTQQLLEGLKEVAGAAAGLTTDMPKVWLSLAEILVSVLSTEVLSSSDSKTATAGLHKLVTKILNLLQKEKGPDWISQRWNLTGINWKDFAPADSEGGIVKENDVLQKVRGLLNELTPQNFHLLMQELKTLLIDNSQQLPGVVDLVFEKAVSEPTYSAVYARMCEVLSSVRQRGGSEEGSPSFHRLLLRRCRHEFENNWLADPERDRHLGELDHCTDPEERKEIQLEMDKQLQKKSVGFIRFVGELFKVGMLTQNVMHRYIQGLLKQGGEVSLECLCELLTAVGKRIDTSKRGKEKEEEKEAGEEQVGSDNERKLVGFPNKGNEKQSAAVLEEEKEEETAENTAPEPVPTEPEQINREGQWSPFNPDGLKKYERDFLIKLRDTAEAKKQPEMCSEVLYFLLKDKVNRPRLPDPSMGPHHNFTHTYTKPQSFRGDLSKYFEEMKVLSKQSGQISSRVRFMIQNVIELRENDWVPRQDGSAQKTVEQIQCEAERESMMEMRMPYGGGGGSRGGHSNRGGDSRKRGGRSEDGWQSVQRKNLDTSKLRIKASDLLSVSPGGSNQFAAWTQGAGGNSDSDCSPAFPQTSKPFAALQDVEDKKRGIGMLSRPYGKQPPSSNEKREKAVNSLRNFVSAEKEECQARTASSGTHPRLSSRNGSSARQTPALSSTQSRDDLAAATLPVASSSSAISDQDARKNLPHLSPDQVPKKTQFILEEFINNNSYSESALSVSETFPPSNMGNFVTETMNILLERSAPVRSNVGKLMGHLMKEGILTTEQFLQGFKEIVEVADDLAIDVPKVWVYLAEILVPMLATEALSFSDLKTATTGQHQLVAEILHLLVKEKGYGWIWPRWDKAGMSWKDFAPANCMDRMVKESVIKKMLDLNKPVSLINIRHYNNPDQLDYTTMKLEFTVGDSVALDAEAIHAKLLQMLRPQQGPPTTIDEVTKWISANVGDRAKTPEFIRVLTTAVCESVYQTSSSKKFEEALFSKYTTLLQKYIDTNEELELHCLYAVQELNHRLQQPRGLLCSLFQSLWDYGCVANETFLKWEQSRDPAFVQGKDVALESLTPFFTELRKVDEDLSDEYASG